MTPSRIPELDGLRGLAILLVLFSHYVAIVPGGPPASALSRFQRLFSMNWIGVDLFFVLSGYLIGGILLNVRKSPSYFRTFYIRRFFRIFPLYYIWILCYISLVAIAGRYLSSYEASTPQAHLSLARQFLFLQNLTFGQYAGLGFAWFSSTWSLAVEEQFYLVSPLLVHFLSIRSLSIVLCSVILSAPLVRLFVRSHLTHGVFMAYVLAPCRADDLAMGMLVAIAWQDPTVRHWLSSNLASLYGVLGLMFIGVIGWWRWASPYGVAMQTLGYTWMGVSFAVLLVVLLVRPTSLLGQTARVKWLRELGKVSYCVYIIHLTVNLCCHILILRNAPQISNWPGALTTLFAAALTYLVAKLSWIAFENPLLQYGHEFRYLAPPKVIQAGEGAAGAFDSQGAVI